MMAGNEMKSPVKIDKWCTTKLSKEPPLVTAHPSLIFKGASKGFDRV